MVSVCWFGPFSNVNRIEVIFRNEVGEEVREAVGVAVSVVAVDVRGERLEVTHYYRSCY